MFKHNCLLGLNFVLVTLVLRLGISAAYSYPPPTEGHFEEAVTTSKQQLCHTIAKSFLDGSNFLKCLSRQQSATCDPIGLLYQAMDLEVDEIKRLDNNALTKDNLFNFIGASNENAWKRIRNIPPQCAGNNFDCSSQDNNDFSMHNNVPQEIIEMIEHTQRGGTLMMSLLDNNPDDLTLNAIEDILDKCVIGVHRNTLGSQTSFGLLLSQIKVLNNDMEALVSGQLKPKVAPSKQQLCHTIAKSFLDGSNYLKCLSRQQSATCDPISLLYQAMDIEVDEIKRLDNNALTKDNLFNFIGASNENAWKRLRNIPSQCAGHNFDCSSQDNNDFSMHNNVSQEIIEMIEHTQRGGTLMMSLLDNNPDDLTLNAIEDILDKCVIGVHRNTLGSQTSFGLLLSQIKVLNNDMEALVSGQLKTKVTPSKQLGINAAYSYPPPTEGHFKEAGTTSKQQLCHTIAKSFLDGSNYLKCLSRQQSATCDPISLFYQAMDIEVDEIKRLDNNALTKDNLFNFIGASNENSWKRIRNIPPQCAGHSFDCSSQNDIDFSMHSNIPQEIIEMIDHTQRGGTLMMSLLNNNPDDLTLNAIEDILDMCVIGVHRNAIGSQTSVGVILSQIKKLVNDMETLVAEQLKPAPQAPTSKLQKCHKVATLFVDGANFLKCLTRPQFSSCNAIGQFYQAMDLEVNGIKQLANSALTKENLFNYLGSRFASALEHLLEIPSKCLGHSFDCSQDDYYPSTDNNIPQEVIDLLEHTQLAGKLVLQLLDKHPDDLTSNAIEDILSNYVLDIHKSNAVSGTSIGVILSHWAKVIENLQKLDSVPKQLQQQLKPAPQAPTSKLQKCHKIATLFVDGSNFLKCLTRPQFSSCNAIGQFYQATGFEVTETKRLANSALTKENLFNYFGSRFASALEHLLEIPSKCLGHSFDCSQDDYYPSTDNNVPQEVIDLIEHTQLAGHLVLQLLDKHPDDLTSNAIEDILSNFVLDIHKSNAVAGTSIGVILPHWAKIVDNLQKLDSVPKQLQQQLIPAPQAPTSKLQKCHKIATLFVDGSNFLKCLTRPQFSSCNAIGQFYQATGLEVTETKQLANSALTKENLFNYFGSRFASALEHLLEIPSKCLGHSFDCSQDDYYPSTDNNVPQEVIDLIEHTQLAGHLVLQLLDKHPDDLTSNAIEDILSNFVLDIHKSNAVAGTSIGVILPHWAKIVDNLQKLDSVPKQLQQQLIPAPQAPTSKLQKCHKIATLFVDGSNFLKCLTRPQFSSCNAIGQFYQATGLEVTETKQLANSALTKENLFNYFGSRFASALEHLLEIPSKCLGHSFDCSQDDYYPSTDNNVPQEVIDLIEHTQLAGHLVLQLLDKHPDDLTSNAIEDILSNFVLDIHKSNAVAGTSIGVILPHWAKIVENLQKLDSVPNQLQQYQTIGRGFLDSAYILKCLTQKHFSTCDSVKEIYNAVDTEVFAAIRHSADATSIDQQIKYIHRRFPSFYENLHKILVKCTGHGENDCLHQQESDPNVKIPQELQDYIEQFHQAGIYIGRLFEKAPSDFVLNSFGEILGYFLHEIQHADIASSTPLSIVLGHSKILIQKLQKLEQAIAG